MLTISSTTPHVRQHHVAFLVGRRITRVIDHAPRTGVLDDLLHSHPLRGLTIDRCRFENDLLGAVGFTVRTGNTIRVGQIAGDRVETHGLRCQGTAGDMEDIEYAHGDYPCVAAICILIRCVMKVRPASY